jgi:hypothetical protein
LFYGVKIKMMPSAIPPPLAIEFLRYLNELQTIRIAIAWAAKASCLVVVFVLQIVYVSKLITGSGL